MSRSNSTEFNNTFDVTYDSSKFSINSEEKKPKQKKQRISGANQLHDSEVSDSMTGSDLSVKILVSPSQSPKNQRIETEED